MELEDLIFAGQGEGWQHLSRMARHGENSAELPEETLAYFSAIAQVLIDENTKLAAKNATRIDIHNVLSATAIKALKITIPHRGQLSNKHKSLEELKETQEWKYATRVYELLTSEPPTANVFEAVGIEYGDPNIAFDHAIDPSVIRKAWKNLRHMVVGSVNSSV